MNVEFAEEKILGNSVSIKYNKIWYFQIYAKLNSFNYFNRFIKKQKVCLSN